MSVTLPDEVAAAVERSASPRLAGVSLQQLAEDRPELALRLEADAGLVEALVAVLAASRSLGQLCRTDPAAIDVLAALGHRAPPPRTGVEDLVRWQRLELLRIAARDLTALDGLEQVGSALARMADDVWAGAAVPEGAAVIAMGKYGGEELNYASDVDVMFVGDADVRAGTRRGAPVLPRRCRSAPRGPQRPAGAQPRRVPRRTGSGGPTRGSSRRC